MKKITSRDYSSDYFKLHEVRYLDKDSWSKKRVADIIRMVKPKKDEWILDLGCGIGVAGLECARRGSHVLGVDFSADALRIANKLKKKMGLAEQIDFVCSTVNTLPVKQNNKFRKVMAADLIEHLYPQQFKAMLKECYRVLEPGGELFIYTPNPEINSLLIRTIGVLERLVKRFSNRPDQNFSETKKSMIKEHNERYEQLLHVGLKNLQTIVKSLKENGFMLKKKRATRIPFEKILGRVPFARFRLGGHLCISAKKIKS